VKGIILPIRGTDLTTVPDHIMEEAQSSSRLAIDRTIVVPVTGTDARITSGGQGTGRGGTVSKSGSVAITSCEDTELRGVQGCASTAASRQNIERAAIEIAECVHAGQLAVECFAALAARMRPFTSPKPTR
jgi:hypothetical protein